ncbi:hypothetical protein [Micromonospora sp. CA-244673]|uniref:hypothetical protein n=1 Tax=Micromonospora sp. CA-244673 TaxID=3239958 RepID=UPI003D8F08ED
MTGTDGCAVRLEPESGVVIDGPSEDAIFEAMGDLDSRDNTFLTIEPTGNGQEWYVVISSIDTDGSRSNCATPRPVSTSCTSRMIAAGSPRT